jgi:hypothetical protein
MYHKLVVTCYNQHFLLRLPPLGQNAVENSELIYAIKRKAAFQKRTASIPQGSGVVLR